MANTIKLGNGNWATKEGSLLAYNDENNNFKPLPFTTTRASSATVVNKQGLIETVGSGIPRIDFSDDTKGALLLEPSRTNSLLQSNQFDTTWTTGNASLTYGESGIGGSIDAWKLTTTSTSSSKIIQTETLSGLQVLSIYAKANTSDFIVLEKAGTGGFYSWFDLRNGIVGTSVGVSNTLIESVGNGWYRCSIIGTISSATRLQIFVAESDGVVTNPIGSSIYIQYAQLEQGSYATSYIPTQGTTQTRVADTASGSGNSTVINSSEGVLYAEISALANDGTNRYISLSDGSTSNRVNIFFDTNNRLRVFYNGLSGSISINIDTTINNKIAFKYKSGDSALFVNGTEVATRTDSLSLVGLDSVSFYLSGGSVFYGKIKDLRVYATALSDEELTTLTTI